MHIRICRCVGLHAWACFFFSCSVGAASALTYNMKWINLCMYRRTVYGKIHMHRLITHIILKRLVKRESDRQGNKLLITEIENCAKITQNNSKANVWYARECEFTKFQQCRSLEVTVTSLRVLLVGVVCHWFQDRQFNAKCNKIKYWWITSVNNRYG